MRALSSPIRLMIIDELSRGERCVCELQPLFAIGQSTLSRHLAALKNVGILAERREGTKVFHRLATPCILNAFACVMGVLQADARQRADVSGLEDGP